MASSSSSSNPPPPQETSYVEMSKPRQTPGGSGGGADDPFLVGQHCQLEYCNQLDFLPFKCQSCGRIYCLDHRTEDAHKCARAGAWAERRRQALAAHPSIGQHRSVRDRNYIPPGSACAAAKCDTPIGTALNTGVHCDTCRRNYCLRHRLGEEHDCAARAAQLREKADKFGVESAMETFKARWSAFVAESKEKAKKSSSSRGFSFKPRPSPAAERLKRMNELKKSAKGDAKLAADKRVYLIVAAGERNRKNVYPKENFFYSRDWVVGRLLDAAAKAMQIENVNNQSADGDERLHVFHVEGERFLEYSEKIGGVLQNGHRVVLTRGGIPPDEVIAMLIS